MEKGRKSKYYTHIVPYLEYIAQWAKMGATDREIMKKLNIGHTAFNRYKHLHEEFRDALKVNSDFANATVEASLYKKCNGYDTTETTIHERKDAAGNTIFREVKKVVKHVPPDTTAQKFWLSNRKQAEWRDKQDLKIEGDMQVSWNEVKTYENDTPPTVEEPKKDKKKQVVRKKSKKSK